MEKENEKVLASGPKGNETAAGENSNYGTELQKGGGRDELEEREEVQQRLQLTDVSTETMVCYHSCCSSARHTEAGV
ncbi:unnamed protein product [Pleuronectes platessa]|uniref:Uncharacterized protein n=1 Tax=Pleuronectes platessa TaxID=8262 RepID=A0A9N7TJL2_PLEPL|nr:unnamed protein product [Pleuronectes platessa]